MTNVITKCPLNLVEAFKDCRDMDADETLRLLKMYGFKFMSWGPNAFTRVGKKALRFKVQGHHHKGLVYICVSGADEYEYILTTVSGNVKKVQCNIYFEDLFDLLDADIEKIAAYKD